MNSKMILLFGICAMQSYLMIATSLKQFAHKQNSANAQLKSQNNYKMDCSKKLSVLKKQKVYGNQLADRTLIPNSQGMQKQKNIEDLKQDSSDKILGLLALSYCLYKVLLYGYALYEMDMPYVHKYLNNTNFTEPGWMEWILNGLSKLCPDFIINGSRHVRLISFALGTTVQAITFKTAAHLVLFGAKADIFDLYKKTIRQVKRVMRITKDVILYY